MRPRRSSDVVVRPLNFTVRRTIRKSRVAFRCGDDARGGEKIPSLPRRIEAVGKAVAARRQLRRASLAFAAAAALAFGASSFDKRCASFGGGVARRRAVGAVPRGQGGFVRRQRKSF